MDNDKFQELVLRQLEALAQGQVRLDVRLDKVDSRLDQVEVRLDKVDSRLGQVEVRLDKVDSRFDQVENHLDKLELRLKNEAFNKIAATLDGYAAISETLADHTVRLQRIEEKVADHAIKIEVLSKTKAARRRASK